MTNKKEIKKYCSGIDCLTCDEAEPCIYRIANKLQEQLKRKEEECEELKKKLQAQRAFTAQEQRKIYCVAYDKTCETGNECKQKKCVFEDRLKFKQALDEIKEITKDYCKKMCMAETKETCDDCINNEIYNIISKAKRRGNDK